METMKKLIIAFTLIVMIMPVALAVEPTQQFNKIYLDPFYRQSMVPQDYNYTFTINPPDGVGDVVSAIVTFQMWLNPTIEFFVQVDGQACNTASYEVHTTYAGAGEGTIFFDCGNIINHAGTYTVTLTPDGDTGAITGWLDLTYMNKPRGDMEVFGTEYQVGDSGKTFIQLLDNEAQPINNATCYINIFHPNSTQWMSGAAMLEQPDEKGLYYYDFTAPNNTGVYMLNVECFYFTTETHYFDGSSEEWPDITQVTGTVSGSGLSLNEKNDGAYVQHDSTITATKSTDAYYDFNLTGETNFTNIDIHYLGESTQTNTLTFYAYNWTSATWITLPNILTYSATARTNPISSTGIDEYISNPIPTEDTINENGTLRLRLYSNHPQSHTLFHNWLVLHVSHQVGAQINEVRGGGEIHIEDYGFGGISGLLQQIWDFLTGWLTTTVTEINETANNVQNNTEIIISMVDDVPQDVWEYANRILTYYPDTNATAVWDYPVRNLTYYAPTFVNVTEVADAVWNSSTRTLTYYYNATEDVWYFDDRQLTYYPDTNASAVWQHPTRNLTFYDRLYAVDVWTYVDRNLTYYQIYNATEDVWNYPDRVLTYLNATPIANETWEWNARYTHGEDLS
jgi:hypothetical protein